MLMQTNALDRYVVRPPLGVVDPGKMVEVHVMLNFVQAHKDGVDLAAVRDRFQVLAVAIEDATEEILAEVWSIAPEVAITKTVVKSKFSMHTFIDSLSHCYMDVASIPAKLKCVITGEPPLEARVHGACNALFDRAAIEQWVAGKREPTCPSCRAPAPLSAFAPVGIVQSMLDELQVRCREPGCAWTGERGSLAEHTARFCELARSRAALEAKRRAMEQELVEERRRKEERELREVERLFELWNPHPNDLAKFCCMGVPVHVPRKVFDNHPNSMLAMMLDGRLTPNRNANGEILLNVSPDVMRASFSILQGPWGPWPMLPEAPSRAQAVSVSLFLEHAMRTSPLDFDWSRFEAEGDRMLDSKSKAMVKSDMVCIVVASQQPTGMR